MIIGPNYNSTQLFDSIMNQQNKLYESFFKINNNQKYLNISENPYDASQIVKLNQELSQIGTYSKNIEEASTQIKMQDEVFSSIVDKMQRIYELTTMAANGASGEDGLTAAKNEIQQLKENIVDLANTKYNGKYIFAGTNVTTQPFELAEDGSITYHGTASGSTEGAERYFEISEGVKVSVNTAGDEIFGTYDPNDPANSSGLFGVLGDLTQALESGDTEQIRNQLDNIENATKHISEIQSIHSTTMTKLTMTKSLLDDTELSLTSQKSEISDIELTSAISELMKQNTALQASMQSYSLISGTSLLDYI